MRNSMMTISYAVHAALNAEMADGAVDLDLARAAVEAEDIETPEEVAQRKERLTKAAEQAMKASKDNTAMPDELVGLANREIKECWNLFASKGGVWDLSKQVKTGLRNISAHILTIAKECAAHAWKRCEGQPDADFVKLAGALFRNAMASAELSLRGSLDLADDEAEAKLDAFLSGSWNVYKSQVKTSFDAGFDPRDFESIFAITKAAKAAKAAKATGTRTDAQNLADTMSDAAEAAAQAGGQGNQAESDDQDDGDADDYEGHEDETSAEVLSKGSAQVKSALILLLRAVDTVDVDAPKTEERLVNILSMATREINKLTRKVEQDSDEESEELAVREA